ncbi:amidase [Erythrobacter mangrovi]|uniref:Amidase n=1 Tax=Erythrobacter mangrovi TaxID=2739433 RepID=A0A7D4AU88_9SPHN|nr:amidase family protein [Erythrobacter mangrovi]QKG71777.1 amidase [Erythrobacter mangrovi]
MGFAEYDRFDALGLAGLVAKGEVTPLELVDTAIERIEELNPRLNAVVFTDYEGARERARGPLPDGPFRGVPFLLKDILGDLEGWPTRNGSHISPPVPMPFTATLVQRFLAGGLVPLGKTNVPEFGLVATTESKLYGPAGNPWNPNHSTGGSSGGSGAAVASGMVPVAHANDGGGSIRIPASCNGLVGLKPTRARNPLGPMLGDVMGGLVAEHVVSRSVRDTAAMLDVTAGAEPGDPYFAPPGPANWQSAAAEPCPKLRIGFARTRPGGGAALDPQAVAAVEHAAKLCADLGHQVEEASPPITNEDMFEAFIAIWASGVAMQIDGICALTGQKPGPDNLEGLTRGLYAIGQATSAPQLWGAIFQLQQIGRAVAGWHADYDVWLTPTLGTPPPANGTFVLDSEDVEAGFGAMTDYVPFTAIQNATGQPAINVPLWWTPEGLPMGTQFVGRVGEEALLLQLATQLETAQPWFDRRPAL